MALVRNLSTLETKEYTCSPRDAVTAAYAQEHGDFNTWNYEQKYGLLIRERRACYGLGDWATFKDGREG
jgi:hypothetical protein